MLPQIARFVFTSMVALSLVISTGCGGGDSRGRFAYNLSLTGLPDSTTLGGHYEGWAVVKGIPVSTGKFVVDGSGPGAIVRNPERTRIYGTAASAEFGPSRTELGEDFPYLTESSHLFFTIEPAGDRDQVPSCNVILAGIISGTSAVLSPTGVAVGQGFPCAQSDGSGGFFLGLQDFSQVSGSYQLLSPTDDVSNATPNDHAGVWFVASTATALTEGGGATPNFAPGLDLPPLASGLRYEGWAVVDGAPRSLGTFRGSSGRDDDAMIAPQRGPDGPGFDFPGGDFVSDFIPPFMIDPPALDLTSSANFMDGDFRAFVTVEPARDNDPAPFQLELLSAVIPPSAVNTNLQTLINVTMASGFANLPTIDAAVTATDVTLMNVGLVELASGGGDRRGHFELWADLGGSAVGVGRFVIDGGNLVSLDSGMTLGTTMMAVFDAASTGNGAFPDTTAALSLFVTLEDEGDDDGQPDRVLLAGALASNQTTMTVAGDGMGLGLADFSAVSGLFHTSTPTNNDGINLPDDNAGIHFRRRSIFFDFQAVGLVLPTLPAGFVYEGWVEDRSSGRVFSTGRFRNPAGPDEDHSTSPSQGSRRPFALPGKDFLFDVTPAMLMAAQAGSITEVFVTIETVPDNSAAPSFLRVLESIVPPGAVTNGVGGVDVVMTPVFPGPTQFSASMSFEVTN